MAEMQPRITNTPKPALERSGVNRIIQVFATVFVMGVVLFLSAGRLDWTSAWLFLGLYALVLLTLGTWVLGKNPDAINERGRVAKNPRTWDKILLAVYMPMSFVVLIVAGLDTGRLGWSVMPVAVQCIGMLSLGLGMGLTFWAMAVNPFLSTLVQIQIERGHRAVATGPYHYVRHPMYLGTLVLWPGISLLLGSWWALLPSAVIIVVFMIRTALEDRTLQAELPGYAEYARRVRYRLLPGVW